MNSFYPIIVSLALLIAAGCSTSIAPVDAQHNIQTIEQLPTNTLILPTDNNAPLYYTADEIAQLTSCAVRARQAEMVAQEKPDEMTGFLSKNDYAMSIFKSCAITNNMTDERVNRAAFCMSGQFIAEYIWTVKQQGASEKDVRHRLADSNNKAVPLIAREIYNHDAESLDNARTRLWDNCIYNFKNLK